MLTPAIHVPILYSFRRCPYCIRAHMALKVSGIKVELRDVKLNDMPEEATRISPKATVPILKLPDGTCLDESWDIVKWALQQNDPDSWQGNNNVFLSDAEALIELNDFSFKENLDHYKYFDRYPEHNQRYYRHAGEVFIAKLEKMLTKNQYLLGDKISLADISVFPFIRQFSLVDKTWFDSSPYPHLQQWLDSFINQALFQQVFQKHKVWLPGNIAVFI